MRSGFLPSVDVHEARRRLDADGALLIDVRERDEFAELRVPGAALIPMSELGHRFRELPMDRPLLVMCAVGGRSATATDALLRAGWPDVTNVAGGINAWNAAGLPTTSGPPLPSEGVLPGPG